MPETIETPHACDVQAASHAQILVESLSDSLEAMAFISLMPLEDSVPPPAAPNDPVRLSLLVRGPFRGMVELAAPLSLGSNLAANIFEPGTVATDSPEVAADSLRELMNVVCGRFLRGISRDGCDMELPLLKPMSAEQWQSFVTGPGTAVLDAEGSPIAVRATLVAAS
jgi:hypothetical protein